jgi:hypothetical protein
MAETQHSDALRALLRDRVDSHEKLDTLLWLRSHAVPTGVQQLERAIELPPPMLRDVLDQLTQVGLVRVDPGTGLFVYAPETAELAHAVDELAAALLVDPVPIIKRMSANAIERVRGSAARAFAEAFLWRRKKPNG